MPEILNTVTIGRRLYPPERVAWVYLTTPTHLRRLAEKYAFKTVGQTVGQAEGLFPNVMPLQATGGEFSDGVGEPHPIPQLIIEPNVVQCQIAGDTLTAIRFMDALERYFDELNPTAAKDVQPYKQTFQTIMVAKLSVPFEAMFSAPMLRFLSEYVGPQLNISEATARMRLQTLNWNVTYQMESSDYFLIPKLITIEPRVGSKLAENVYYTESPLDSDAHIRLLEQFEKEMTAQRTSFLSSPEDP